VEELKEVFKPIKGYEGLYEISNFGRVKSLARDIIRGQGGIYKTKDRIRKVFFDGSGYYNVQLHKNSELINHRIHLLVWDHFGNGKRNGREIQVDHIDNNKQNNRIDNLQLLTNRENCVKYCRTKNRKNKYTGVSWSDRLGKWVAKAYLNGKQKHLGVFMDEHEASLAYKNAVD